MTKGKPASAQSRKSLSSTLDAMREPEMSSIISAAEFGKLLANGGTPYVIDVRRPDEFAEVHVKGARLFPLDDLNPAKVAADLKVPPARTIHVLCKSGMRAGKAADKFRAAGIANVCVVEGGTDACVAAGLPVEGLAKR